MKYVPERYAKLLISCSEKTVKKFNFDIQAACDRDKLKINSMFENYFQNHKNIL